MSTAQALTLDQVVDTARYPLPDPGSAGAQAVISRARHELRTLGCTVLPDFVRPALRAALEQERVAPLAYPVTASFGVAELGPGETEGSLLRRADKALYRGKSAGRNCVVLAQVPVTAT